MARRKFTDGILATDNDGWVVLFELGRLLGVNWGGDWRVVGEHPDYSWTAKEWAAEYDLKPPAPGEMFPVEIEL